MADTNAAQSWRSWVFPPLAIFVASRVPVLAAVYITKLLIEAPTFREVLFHWDATWYTNAAEGYDRRVPTGTGNPAQTDIAFFPAFPLAIRFVSLISGFSLISSGLIASTIFGALAAIALWRLTELIADRNAANRTVALVFLFPGAFAFSTVYPEGLFIFASSICIWALIKEKWLIAGLFGALGGATRPNGVILIACCAWASVFVLLRKREWRALVAPVIAPLGVAAFFIFLALRTGDELAWFKAQSRGWGQDIDFGVNAIRTVASVVLHPLANLNLSIAVGSLFFAALSGWLLIKWRPERAFPLFVIYSIGIIGPIVLSHGFSLTARSLMTAFPLLMAIAKRFEGMVFTVILAVSASVLSLFTLLFGGSLLMTP